MLAEHLYSSKKVGIRELIQNAHDSCVRRQDRGQREEGYQSAHRHRRGHPPSACITISDNGNGLTAEEIGTYLVHHRPRLHPRAARTAVVDSPEEAAQLIGQFGLGFLSAFLLAERSYPPHALGPTGQPRPSLALGRR